MAVARIVFKRGEENLGKTPAKDEVVSDPVAEDRKRQLNTLIGLSDKFGDSLSNTFAKNIAEGKKLDDVFKKMRESLVETGLRMALAPLGII
jgi:hypothetical protein